MRTTSIAPAGEPVVRRNKAPLLASADESCRRVYAYDSDDALSAYIYNIWMAVLTVLPSVERHGTGFFAFIYAYDATRLPATSWGLYSLAGQSRNSPSTFLYACGGSQNPDNYAVNSGASCDSTDYDACRYTTSTSDVLVTLTYDRPSPRCNYAETGLYYYGYRFYMPETGRWPSRDPIGEHAFFLHYTLQMRAKEKRHYIEQTLKPLYQFATGDPIQHYDPFGLADNPCGGNPDKCMTCMAWGEARGAGNACMKAVAQVIWNRAKEKNKSPCEIVSAPGQFNAYNSSQNKGYEQCCKDCIPAGEKNAFDSLMNGADGWPEEFGGGDPQLDGATFFHSGATWPSSWGNQSDYEEVAVPGCSGMHFYKKL